MRGGAIVGLVLDRYKRLSVPKTPIQWQIDTTDAEIDWLVYELYGLTEEEIGIVEEATKR